MRSHGLHSSAPPPMQPPSKSNKGGSAADQSAAFASTLASTLTASSTATTAATAAAMHTQLALAGAALREEGAANDRMRRLLTELTATNDAIQTRVSRCLADYCDMRLAVQQVALAIAPTSRFAKPLDQTELYGDGVSTAPGLSSSGTTSPAAAAAAAHAAAAAASGGSAGAGGASGRGTTTTTTTTTTPTKPAAAPSVTEDERRKSKLVQWGASTTERVALLITADALLESSKGTPEDMIGQTRALAQVTALLINRIKTNAAATSNNEQQQRRLSHAKMLADATSKAVNAAKHVAKAMGDPAQTQSLADSISALRSTAALLEEEENVELKERALHRVPPSRLSTIVQGSGNQPPPIVPYAQAVAARQQPPPQQQSAAAITRSGSNAGGTRGLVRIYDSSIQNKQAEFKGLMLGASTTALETIALALQKYGYDESPELFALSEVKTDAGVRERVLTNEETPFTIKQAWEESNPPDNLRFYLKRKKGEASDGKGVVRVYAGMLKSAVEFKTVPASLATTVPEVIKAALGKFQIKDDPANFTLLEVQMHRGVIERPLDKTECPFALKLQFQKQGVTEDMVRFYLRKNKLQTGLEKAPIRIWAGSGVHKTTSEFKSIFVSSMTQVPAVIKMALDKFMMSETGGQFALIEVQNGMKERVMNDSECPLATILALEKRGFTSGTARLYLRRDDTAAAQLAPSSPGNDERAAREQEMWQVIRGTDENNYCADCNASDPQFVSINLGAVLCHKCACVHNALSAPFWESAAVNFEAELSSGKFFSKIRAVTHSSWSAEFIKLFQGVGNAIVNQTYEHGMIYSLDISKPLPDAADDERQKFISAKYVDKAFVEAYLSAVDQSDPDSAESDTKHADALQRAMSRDLFLACEGGEVVQVMRLIALGANVNFAAVDKDAQATPNPVVTTAGSTPLHVASSNGYGAIVTLLLEAGASPVAADCDGNSPLYYAELSKHADIVTILSERQQAHHLNHRSVIADASKAKLMSLSHFDFSDLFADVLSETQDRHLSNVRGKMVPNSNVNAGQREGRRKLAMLDDAQFAPLAKNVFMEVDSRQRELVARVRTAIQEAASSEPVTSERLSQIAQYQTDERERAQRAAADSDTLMEELKANKAKRLSALSNSSVSQSLPPPQPLATVGDEDDSSASGSNLMFVPSISNEDIYADPDLTPKPTPVAPPRRSHAAKAASASAAPKPSALSSSSSAVPEPTAATPKSTASSAVPPAALSSKPSPSTPESQPELSIEDEIRLLEQQERSRIERELTEPTEADQAKLQREHDAAVEAQMAARLRKEREALAALQKEQQEQQEREKLQREEQQREQLQREQQERERLQREQRQREQEQREQQERERLQREQLQREQEQREQQEREQQAREQEQREQEQREKAQRALEQKKREQEELLAVAEENRRQHEEAMNLHRQRQEEARAIAASRPTSVAHKPTPAEQPRAQLELQHKRDEEERLAELQRIEAEHAKLEQRLSARKSQLEAAKNASAAGNKAVADAQVAVVQQAQVVTAAVATFLAAAKAVQHEQFVEKCSDLIRKAATLVNLADALTTQYTSDEHRVAVQAKATAVSGTFAPIVAASKAAVQQCAAGDNSSVQPMVVATFELLKQTKDLLSVSRDVSGTYVTTQ
ncbi:hypothetical protein CAOG_03455 [Capsaspora owczarzaki ATCC 30864]|uniref:Uncharacterized protein n=1 Tax=Capsaspora owczarzaki (strain ATCC 30864) TaxID=595528 RepID=A0A0D2X2G1_CAPO3|nr:hypothetical protein CAOG_03455 [Capsaspora owczarzaki ATCC 30864]KJE92499.1 hypothetical protein CAOG_003455 [Capsaspora owczarzaki ATCC 30864]|eukprot:XP_004364294.1 hypothetical protein CAOG_03455 [Capsaspora owczarzaki ATCC 30864]